MQLLSFACSWFKLLLVNYVMTFVALKGGNSCSLVGFLFEEGVDIVAYLIVGKS